MAIGYTKIGYLDVYLTGATGLRPARSVRRHRHILRRGGQSGGQWCYASKIAPNLHFQEDFERKKKRLSRVTREL